MRASPFSGGGGGGGGAQLDDTAPQRLEWFRQGLRLLERLPSLKSVAFPHMIGCGLGGGDWAQYRQAIGAFAARSGVRVTVVKLAGSGSGSGSGARADGAKSRKRSGGAGGVRSAGGGTRSWVCSACTFVNCNPEGLACEICGTPRCPADAAGKRQKTD